jgi:hypothetical protein
MNLFNKLNPLVFLISFSLGFFILYIFGPRPDILYQYPNPTKEDTVFQDDANNCYKYKSKKISCPNDKKMIQTIPLQFGKAKL